MATYRKSPLFSTQKVFPHSSPLFVKFFGNHRHSSKMASGTIPKFHDIETLSYLIQIKHVGNMFNELITLNMKILHGVTIEKHTTKTITTIIFFTLSKTKAYLFHPL